MGKQDGTGRQITAAPIDDLTAHLLHVDMDAFFASVELLEHPELVGKPVIVGHPSARSVVTAATYEARKFGVNSAMPMAVALRRCPQAIVLEPHHDRYTKYSGLVMDLFRDITPMVEVLGIDEAFLDVAGARRLLGTPWQIGTLIRERVFAETGLRCSVGAAATKYVAKLASSRAKPDGLLVVPEPDTLAFLHPQPISALWGVGAKTAEKLDRLGLRTVGDVANIPVDALSRAIGPATAAHFHALSWGWDPRMIVTEHTEKSIGHERTFEANISDGAALEKEMLRLANAVGCGSTTSRRSRDPALSPSPPTSAAASTRRRDRSTPSRVAPANPSDCSGSAVSNSPDASRFSASGTTTTTGEGPSTPWMPSQRSSAVRWCAPRRCSATTPTGACRCEASRASPSRRCGRPGILRRRCGRPRRRTSPTAPRRTRRPPTPTP